LVTTSSVDCRALLDDLDAIIWEADPQTIQFSFVSQKAERLLGYPVRQWLEDRDFWVKLIHPEDREWVVATCAAAVQDIRDHTFDYRVRSADGRTVWVRDVVHVTGDARKRPTQLTGVMLDITAWKLAEEAAKIREQRYTAILENSIDLITFVDADGHILFDSPSIERLLGVSAAERLGRSIFELIHPEDLPRARAAFATAMALRKGTPFIEVRLRHKDGRWRVFESAGNYIEDGGVRMGIVHSRDITDRKHLEEQLRHAQKMEALGRLTGAIAHDFNNLLTVILGYAEALLDSEVTLPVRAELREIRRASSSAASLTRQLLVFGRRMPAVLEPMDLNHVIFEVSPMLRRLLGKSVQLALSLEARHPIVKADRGLLDQVLMNLLINGRDAMRGGGTMTIATRDGEDGCVLLDVTDTGHGMSPEVQAKIFEPFFTTKDPGKGTGLGLATVYTIVTQAGGTIEVESAEGEGTTFRISLPLVGRSG
jgi:two-component system, cell cycle sensor histidine kinase and response regulator CckA